MSRFLEYIEEKCLGAYTSKADNKKDKKKDKEVSEAMKDKKSAKRLPYNASIYIQEEDAGHVVYLDMGGNTWYKEVKDKAEALKEFNNAVSRATKNWKQI